MSKYKDKKSPIVSMPAGVYLRDLANRLEHVPTSYGTNSDDIERLRWLASWVEGMGEAVQRLSKGARAL